MHNLYGLFKYILLEGFKCVSKLQGLGFAPQSPYEQHGLQFFEKQWNSWDAVIMSSNGSNSSSFSSQSLASSISSEHERDTSDLKKASDHKPSIDSSVSNTNLSICIVHNRA
jgi:hypothetical protein